jgi:hypothetical protein
VVGFACSRRWIVALLVSVIGVAATVGTGEASAAGSAASVTVVVNQAGNGRSGADFAGFSYEKDRVGAGMFDARDGNLVGLFRLLGPSVLRLGGNLVDVVNWNATGSGGSAKAIAPSDVDKLAGFVRATGLAPFSPSQNMSTDHVPTMVIGGQNDTVVTPSYLNTLYATLPAATPSAFVQIAGASHVYYTRPNNVEMKVLIPWLKIFVDNDTATRRSSAPRSPTPAPSPSTTPSAPTRPRMPPSKGVRAHHSGPGRRNDGTDASGDGIDTLVTVADQRHGARKMLDLRI